MPRLPLHLPEAAELLKAISVERPLAIVLAGHHGSGKSTLWYDKLADVLKIPLVNADRLTLSMLPAASGKPPLLRPWAVDLRDNDERWQRLSQKGVALFLRLIMDERLPFAFETVFSYLEKREDGTYRSKEEIITALQNAGYSVALLFVGLANPELSVARVATRREQGGHDVPLTKLLERFPRTQEAIRLASSVAAITIMFDNSRDVDQAFTMVRVQTKSLVHYDCRNRQHGESDELIQIASTWLSRVAPMA